MNKQIKKVGSIKTLIEKYIYDNLNLVIFIENNESQYVTYNVLKKYDFRHCYLLN